MANSTSRRALAGGAVLAMIGATVAAATTTAPSTDDAELANMLPEVLALDAQYARLLKIWWLFECGDPGLSAHAAEMDAPFSRLCELADRAMKLKATTAAGFRVKGLLVKHALQIELESDGRMEFETPEQEMVWSLACDLAGGLNRVPC